MYKNVRIIPRMDIKGPNLVKGIHLEGLRVLGKPESFARYYYENGADELLFQDVVASLYERNSLEEIVSRTARELFIPLTVGGGIRSIDDIKNMLRAGADKVSLNTAAIKNPSLIREASLKFGSSTIVVAIEAIRQADGQYLAYTDNGREHTGVEVTEWARRVEELGAGEIIITSVDQEGTGKGFDFNLITHVANAVGIPVVAHGGAGKMSHVAEMLQECDVDGVCTASLLHYEFIKDYKPDSANYEEGNIDFLLKGELVKRFESTTIPALKRYLHTMKLNVRI